jgi:hypothetical protein
MELGRPSIENLQHCLQKHKANSHDVLNVVYLDDQTEYSTNTIMTSSSHEHWEASMYPPDTLKNGLRPGDIRHPPGPGFSEMPRWR